MGGVRWGGDGEKKVLTTGKEVGYAKVGTTQREEAPGPGGEPGTELAVTGLKADGRTETARHQRLHPDCDTVDDRHAATLKRIGLDRVDGSARPIADEQEVGAAEQQATGCRHQREPSVVELAAAAQENTEMEQAARKAHNKEVEKRESYTNSNELSKYGACFS